LDCLASICSTLLDNSQHPIHSDKGESAGVIKHLLFVDFSFFLSFFFFKEILIYRLLNEINYKRQPLEYLYDQ